MIQLHQVSFAYQDLSVLERASFRLERGEFGFLVGDSGSGKTTLLKLLYRELAPTEGSLSVLGQSLADLTPSTLPFFRRKIGVVFQDWKLVETKTVEQNLAIPQKLIGTKHRILRENVNNLLHQMGLVHHKDALPTKISSNEKQRLAIARAIINSPLLLLADQPTETLDPELTLEMLSLFDALNFQGATVLVATSDPELPEKFIRAKNASPKRVFKLKDGCITT
ncbi:MAG: ATP-binding cassette domain-containing protein [Candidatus Poribacteria bacterium]|nr:ATP-binding cassette domain-containing protein [Candidatus Poribacteria bacterium]